MRTKKKIPKKVRYEYIPVSTQKEKQEEKSDFVKKEFSHPSPQKASQASREKEKIKKTTKKKKKDQLPLNFSQKVEEEDLRNESYITDLEDNFICGCNKKGYKNVDSYRTHIYKKHNGQHHPGSSHSILG